MNFGGDNPGKTETIQISKAGGVVNDLLWSLKREKQPPVKL